MNEVVLKSSTVSVIALAVSSALWLADSVQAARRPAAQRFTGGPAPLVATTRPAPLVLAVLPAERAASSAFVRTVGVR
jgi:hypothetical protein